MQQDGRPPMPPSIPVGIQSVTRFCTAGTQGLEIMRDRQIKMVQDCASTVPVRVCATYVHALKMSSFLPPGIRKPVVHLPALVASH